MQTEKSRNIKQFRIRNFQRYIYVFSLYLSKEKANWYHIEIYLRKGSKTNQKNPKDRHLYKLMLFIVKFHFSAHCTVYNGGMFLKKNPPKAIAWQLLKPIFSKNLTGMFHFGGMV